MRVSIPILLCPKIFFLSLSSAMKFAVFFTFAIYMSYCSFFSVFRFFLSFTIAYSVVLNFEFNDKPAYKSKLN